MTVDSIMSREVLTVPPDAALTEVRRLLHGEGRHHILVVDGNAALQGVISDRDVLRALAPFLQTSRGRESEDATLTQPASQVMRDEPVTLLVDTAIEKAANVLLDHDVSALPVVDDETLVGLVTTEHLLQHYTQDG